MEKKKNTRSNKKYNTKKTNGRNERKKNKGNNSIHLTKEIISILYVAIGIMMALGIYRMDGGMIGNICRNFFVGFLGGASYFVPFIFFLWAIYSLTHKKEYQRNGIYIGIGILFLSAFLETVFIFREKTMDLLQYNWEVLKNIYVSKNILSGGVIGFQFSFLFIKLFGVYGTFIFYFFLVLIALVKGFNLSVIHILYGIKEGLIKSKEKIITEALLFQQEEPLNKNVENQKIETSIHNEKIETSIQKEIKIKDYSQGKGELDKSQEISLFVPEPRIQEEVRKEKEEVSSNKEMNKPIEITKEIKNIPYNYPVFNLLNKPDVKLGQKDYKKNMIQNASRLETVLQSFGVQAKVLQVSRGPAVTRYELQPGTGVKVSKIANLADDIALNLAAAGIRIEAPIPGKAAVGIEVPNEEVTPVLLREVIETDIFQTFGSSLAFAMGKDIAGNSIVADIAKMPHLLIAGATGSGKSVCINTLITSILYKANPNEVKLLMIDPKVVELSIYNGIPHLLIPVVTDPKKAAGALNWAVSEMVKRYQLFSENNVRDLHGYNSMKKEKGQEGLLPQIVIIIDELADLMMVSPGEVEDSICRLAQMARAAGLHLVIATQRPSVDVITGVIKANIPSRIAFSVSSQIDSRTILDMAGAEKLLGKGDMLFYPMGASKPQRVQGAFISDKEVEKIVEFVKEKEEIKYDETVIKEINDTIPKETNNTEEQDALLFQAIEFVIEKQKASISMLQRNYRIGYNRAARIIDEMEQKGVISKEDGSKPRKILISANDFLKMKGNTASEEVENSF